MTKKEILEKLKKTYKRTTNNVFNEDCHIFNNHDFTCQLTLNPDKTLTITIRAELCSTDAQETRNNVAIKHYGWNAYNQELDSVIISHYETSETVNELDEIVPTIKKMIRKIKKLEFKERE
jgi:hypothetical protein